MENLTMKRFLREVREPHQTTRVVSASGVRSLESNIQAANIEKRNEQVNSVVETDMGYTIAPIKDWSITDIWSLVNAIEQDDIYSFIGIHTKGRRKHYSDANSGTCGLFAGNNKQTV